MFGRKKRKLDELMATGARAVGTVTAVRDTGMTINDNPRVALSFRVAPLDGSAAFAAEKTATVSRVQIPQTGQRYPIFYDAADPETFMVTLGVDDTGRATIAAMFPGAFGADGSGVGQVAAPAPAAPDPGTTDIASRIRQLDALKAAGVVDDAEYAEQKARILAAL